MIHNRFRTSYALSVFVLFALFFSAGSAQAVELPDEKSPIKIKGDSVEYFFKKEKAEGRGNVRIDHGTFTLTADEVDVDLKTKDAYARGNVVLTQPGAKYTGDAVHVNFETGDAEIQDLEAKVEPFYRGKSDELRRVTGKNEGDEYFVLENSYFTTCDEGTDCPDGTPQYRLEASEVLYYPDEKLEMTHVVMRLRNLPIFYFPKLILPIKDIDEFPIQLELGKNDEWGFFALSKYRYYLNDDHDGNLLLDFRENQEFAWGAEHYYRNEQWGNGALRTYFANDRCGLDDTDCSRSGEKTSDETHRYRLQMRHTGKIDENTGLNFEFNKLSDENVIQDFFFREEFERTLKPENYLSVIRATDDYTLSGLVRYRMDDFVEEVERLPEVRFDTHTDPLGDTPFYFRSETSAAWLNKTFKDFEEEEKNRDSARIDQKHRLSYVWRINEWTATPHIGSRHIFYSRDAYGSQREFVRSFAETGIDVSTKYFKVYDVQFDAFGIKFDKMRHVFTPNISYLYRSKPTYFRDQLIQFDAIDDINNESLLTFDIENKLQIKYREESEPDDAPLATRTLVRSITSVNMQIPRGNESRLESIDGEMEFYPYTWLGVGARTRYSFEGDEIEGFEIDLNATRDKWKLGVGQRYVNGQSNQTTWNVSWQATDDWKFEVYQRFDFARSSVSEGGENNEIQFAVEKRNFFCWTIRVIYNHSHDSDGVFVTLTPSAFPETSYRRNQTYRSLRTLESEIQ